MLEFYKQKLQLVKDSPAIYSMEQLTTTQEVVDFMNTIEKLDLSPTKKLIVIGLNCKNKPLMYTEVASGSARHFDLLVADIFKPLLVSNSERFVLVYNNVSGDATICDSDKTFCKKIRDASKIMGIEFIDHIIIADNIHVSVIKEIQ